MLKLNDLFENFDLAKNCIEYWEHDPDTLPETLRWFRISSNAVYPFRQRDGLCFLRLCPSREKPLAMVESEIAVIRRLRKCGFAAMEPVPMKDGRFCAQLDTPWGRYTASCFRQVAGQQLEDLPASRRLVEGYGRCLGQLHRLMRGWEENRRNHKQLLEETEQRLTRYGAPEGVMACFRETCRKLDGLPITQDTYGLIHYDFEPDNVFFDAESDRYAVIDFDDMLHCWFALDVVRALDGLEDLPPETPPLSATKLQEAFLAGYRSEYTLDAAQEASLPLMRTLVRLVEYAGLLRVLAEPVAQPPEWMQQLCSRLGEKCRWLERELSVPFHA